MSGIKKTLNDAVRTILRPYYSFRIWKPVWEFLNRDARQKYGSGPALTTEQVRIVKDLEEHGIALSSIDVLFPGKNLLAELQERATLLTKTATPNTKKTFLTQLIELYPELNLEDVFVRFALSDEVLSSVSSYLNMWPKLYYYTLGVTNPVAEGEMPRQSQRWHRDPEDRRMCKVFIYLNGVDETAGPFKYVKGSTRGNRWGDLYPQRPPDGRYPPDGVVESTVAASDILTCTGTAGAVIFADTSGLHKGGYATAKERVMSTTGFVTSACPRGVFYTRGHDFETKAAGLSPAARFALENTKIANRKLKY